MKYKGKVDWWILLAFLAGIVGSVVPVIQKHSYAPLAIPVVVILLLATFGWPQTYTTAGDALYLRAGLTKRVIPWSEITSVSDGSEYRGFNVVLSRDRVLIQCTRGDILIAPTDQVRFFDDVASHCPQLSRRGMDLVISLS